MSLNSNRIVTKTTWIFQESINHIVIFFYEGIAKSYKKNLLLFLLSPLALAGNSLVEWIFDITHLGLNHV